MKQANVDVPDQSWRRAVGYGLTSLLPWVALKRAKTAGLSLLQARALIVGISVTLTLLAALIVSIFGFPQDAAALAMPAAGIGSVAGGIGWGWFRTHPRATEAPGHGPASIIRSSAAMQVGWALVPALVGYLGARAGGGSTPMLIGYVVSMVLIVLSRPNEAFRQRLESTMNADRTVKVDLAAEIAKGG